MSAVTINKSLVAVIILFIVAFLTQLFQWSLIDILTPFIFPLLQGLIALAIIISFIVSGFRFFKSRSKIRVLVFFISLITLIIYSFFPFTSIALNLDFNTKLSERKQVVVLVQKQTLKPNVSYDSSLIKLPNNFPNVSAGGNEIIVQNYGDSPEIFFFTYRGILSSYSGFLYTQGDVEPAEFWNDTPIQVFKLRDHWYFMAFSN
jgi:hypothetical protein